MTKYKILKTVMNGSGTCLEDNHFEDGKNSIGYEVFTPRGLLKRWKFSLSTSSLDMVADSLASYYLETKRDEREKYNPFKLSNIELDFSSKGVKWKDGYGFYFTDLRELTNEERDQLIKSTGKKIREDLKEGEP